MDVQYDMALDAMNELTGGQAEMLGAIEVTTEQVDQSECGIVPVKARRHAKVHAKAFSS
jgi:hypothetical protein